MINNKETKSTKDSSSVENPVMHGFMFEASGLQVLRLYNIIHLQSFNSRLKLNNLYDRNLFVFFSNCGNVLKLNKKSDRNFFSKHLFKL